MEPNKLESWNWYSLDALPKPMFEAAALALEALARGDWCTKADFNDFR